MPDGGRRRREGVHRVPRRSRVRVAVVANARMPTERAHGVQLVRMCAALAAEGAEVELVVPDRRNALGDDLFGFYGVAECFAVRRLPTWDLAGRVPAGARWQRATFIRSAVARLAADRPGLVMTRDEWIAALLAPRVRTIYECHRFPGRALVAWGHVVRRAHGVVSTNQWKAQVLVDRLGVDPERLVVLPNATDVDAISRAAPRPGLRRELGLPAPARLVVHAGHLYGWKGVDTLARSVSRLPADVHVLLVGGTDRDIARFRRRHHHPRLHVLGRVPHGEVAGILRSADVLVLANTASTRESRQETSPLKLFEYMASGRPIVASDLPAIREITGDDCALLVPPGDPAALASAITTLLDDDARARRLAEAARARVRPHDWSRRARALLRFADDLPRR
ncbi:MAG: glycosyltransferase [Deltaproteobacteria bacterium]|nr:MAG: glycosyltransferase [Deltaproteobacteria bacterium]